VLGQRGDRIFYHDPDWWRGGPRQERDVQSFLDAWQEWGFTSLVVKRETNTSE
jgi:hypothetical protein